MNVDYYSNIDRINATFKGDEMNGIIFAMNKKMCAYVGCERGVPANFYLCKEHYQDLQDGLIDKCPRCGRYKNKENQLCKECYVTSRSKSIVEEKSEKWNNDSDRYFVYVMKMNDGNFYVGHTSDMRIRLSEHEDGKVVSTKSKEPKLMYFEIYSSREEVTKREVELKNINEKNNRLLRRMILDFQDLIKEVNLK